MPAYPRKHLVSRAAETIVHCWSRCIRRAWLCGKDARSGRDYEHRRDWIWEVEEQLAGLFAIEVEFRSEMQNHSLFCTACEPELGRGHLKSGGKKKGTDSTTRTRKQWHEWT